MTENNASGIAESREYPLSAENVYERFLAPLGRSRTDLDLGYLASIGVYPVREVDAPPYDPCLIIKQVLPQFIGGEWVETYITEVKTDEQIAVDKEIQAINTRQQRTVLLNLSDWTQLPDSPLSEEKKQQWNVYRQALRDLPAQEGYPFNVTWPVQP